MKPEHLTEEETEKTKKNSILDGTAWSVMYGFGEQYVTPYAIRLGASNTAIGILASVPAFIGAICQFLGAKLTDNYRDRKKIVAFFAFAQALILLPLFIVPFLTSSMLWLTALFTLYNAFANMAGPSWSSWIGDVVTEKERARYFSRRNKAVITGMLLSVLIAGLALNYFTQVNIWLGFGILFSTAFLGRLVSWYFLLRQSEPRYHYDPKSYFSFRDFIRKMPQTNFGNFVIFRSLMAFAVMVASPFFAVYMLRNLNFSYIQYTVIVLTPMLVKILTMVYWGRYSDKFGTRNIMTVSGVLIATIPLWWFLGGHIFSHSQAIFYILILAEAVSGFAWAGFELTTFNYILETVSSKKRARCFAYFNMVFGTAVLIGGLLGAWLVAIMPSQGIGALLAVFAVSFILRMTVAVFFAARIREVRIQKVVDERKLMFELVLARPANTAVHYTYMTMVNTGKDIRRFTKDALEEIAIPIGEFVQGIDQKLEKLEPVRKRIEPSIIRRHKKEIYRHMIRQGEKMVKHTARKPRKK